MPSGGDAVPASRVDGRQLPAGYYGALSGMYERSPFLSPVKDPPYAEHLTRFLVAGGQRHVAEVGPGYGELLGRVGAVVPSGSHVWAIDSCDEFLARARAAWSGPPDQLSTVQADLEAEASGGTLERMLDRIVAVNVLQDLELTCGLRTLHRWMRARGRLLVTVLAKETMDLLYVDHPLYDPAAGHYFKPCSSGVVLGQREAAGATIPYERILRFHDAAGLRAAFETVGLEIVSARPVCYSTDAMIARWRAAGTLRELCAEGLMRLRSSGRYVDSHEIVARCAL